MMSDTICTLNTALVMSTVIEIDLEEVTPVQTSAILHLLRSNVCSVELTKYEACALYLFWSTYARPAIRT